MPRNIRRFCCSWDFSDVAHPFSRAFDGRWEDRWDRSFKRLIQTDSRGGPAMDSLRRLSRDAWTYRGGSNRAKTRQDFSQAIYLHYNLYIWQDSKRLIRQ